MVIINQTSSYFMKLKMLMTRQDLFLILSRSLGFRHLYLRGTVVARVSPMDVRSKAVTALSPVGMDKQNLLSGLNNYICKPYDLRR